MLWTGDTILASNINPYFSFSLLPLSAYLLIVVIRASINGRDGAFLLLFSLTILIVTFMNDMLIYQNVIDQEDSFGLGMSGLGILMFLLTQIVILAERWSRTLGASEQMTQDLGQLVEMSTAVSSELELDDLLGRIVAAAAGSIDAARGILFLHDAETDQLKSFVSYGMDDIEISFPADKGFAGECFRSGQTLNIKNAHQDPRYQSEFDTQTGSVYRSILAMPVELKNGDRIGVMQVFNKNRGSVFTGRDVSRFKAYVSQASISLENVSLISAVTQEKNYSDSILGSMSSGVVTVNGRGIIEKLNPAAIEILAGTEQEYLHHDAEAFFKGENAWLADEITLVRNERQPRTLIDIDLKTARGEITSVNASIVPLVDHNENIGSLVLLDDITSEKRLRGTMSRFLTKEVADQVIDSDEDVLAGAVYKVSVMFTDIRNFTGISEKLGARETVSLLNDIFSRMVEEIFSRKGVLDKFIGDAIMAIYGAPLTTEQDADNAVKSSIAIRQVMNELNEARARTGDVELGLGIGIGTGDVIAGTIGSPKRMEYTVIGDSVNLAARLEALTKHYSAGIIICEETLKSLSGPHVTRELDLIRVRGQSKPTRIFEVLDYHTERSFPHLKEVLAHYADGITYWHGRDWRSAARKFEKALELFPDDMPSRLYHARCRAFISSPPPANWDGVWDTQTLASMAKQENQRSFKETDL